jgi:hypothetical protein
MSDCRPVSLFLRSRVLRLRFDAEEPMIPNLLIAIMLAMSIHAAGAPSSPPVDCPVAAAKAKVDEPAVAPAHPIDPVEAILTRQEREAADVRTFTADVRYEAWDDILARREIRSGHIIYDVDAAGRRSFAVLFDRLIVGQRAQDRRKHYIFSGRWLVEVDHETKQFIKRELVPPGRQIDPLKLGEGPIPLPIGQPKDEVLARFDVTLIEPPTEGMLAGLADVDGLRLVPKPGTPEAADYERVDLFYDRATSLPIGIDAVELGGNRKTIRLLEVQRNPELTDEQRAKLSVEEPDPREWSIDVQPLQN